MYLPVIDQVLQFIIWFSQQNPYIVYTFDGTMLVFLALFLLGMALGEATEDLKSEKGKESSSN